MCLEIKENFLNKPLNNSMEFNKLLHDNDPSKMLAMDELIVNIYLFDFKFVY